jgi:hypothetical protein
MKTRIAFRPSAAIVGTLRARRVLVGVTLGGLSGVLLALVAAAGASTTTSDTRGILDATHRPPLLTVDGEQAELRYDVHCVAAGSEAVPCDATGTVFVRAGTAGSFRPIRLRIDESALEERYVAVVPAAIAEAGFSYYAVFESEDAGAAPITLPQGGSRMPQRSVRLSSPVVVSLGAHAFGRTRKADARVFEALWGHGAVDVGLEHGRTMPPIGASSFDVDPSHTVYVLDQAHKRLLRKSIDQASPVAMDLEIDGALADLAVARDGSLHLLESARGDRRPLLRRFTPNGRPQQVVELPERTASQVRVGPRGPVALQYPSNQWLPASATSSVSTEVELDRNPAARPLTHGGEVVVLRDGYEIRALVKTPTGAQRAWRVTSATALAEVQLAEPIGSNLLLVVRVYTDDRDEFLAILLGSRGLMTAFSVNSADWAETAPVSRFRLVDGSLYQLGSSPRAAFVDRYDLGAR